MTWYATSTVIKVSFDHFLEIRRRRKINRKKGKGRGEREEALAHKHQDFEKRPTDI